MTHSCNTARSLSDLKFFQQTCFCLMLEKTFALHHFLTLKEMLKGNVCIFLEVKLYLVGGRLG